jgi:transcriptional regulator with XRE-family HTH domain
MGIKPVHEEGAVMAKLSERSIRLREILKKRLDQRGMTYAALAKKVGVSLPTMKRWMTKDEFSVEALDAMLRELGLSWQELTGVLDGSEIERHPISERDETFLASHSKEAFVFLLLAMQYDFSEIQNELELTAKALEAILLKLDRCNIIAYSGPNNIRVLIRIPFRFSEDGKFSQKYFEPAAKLMFEELVLGNPGFQNVFNPAVPLIRLSEMYLSPKSLVRFKADLWEVVEKYRDLSRIETSFKRRDELFPVAFLIALERFPLWRKVMWEASSREREERK